jgi:hypothetical protein
MLLSTNNEVCLWWLEGTLQRLRSEGQKKVVPIDRVPVERVGDLGVLWAGLSPASLEERQHLYENCAQEEAIGAEASVNRDRFLDLTLK